MLGGYGNNNSDEEDNNLLNDTTSDHSVGSTSSVNKRKAELMSIGADLNIYDDDDLIPSTSPRRNIDTADISDVSDNEEDDHVHKRTHNSTAKPETSSNAATRNNSYDLYAGSDFVRSSGAESPPTPIDSANNNTTSDVMLVSPGTEDLPLPPLKSRFALDDDDDEASFVNKLSGKLYAFYNYMLHIIVANSQHPINKFALAIYTTSYLIVYYCLGGPITATSTTSVHKPATSNGSGLISFSLKKKPVRYDCGSIVVAFL